MTEQDIIICGARDAIDRARDMLSRLPCDIFMRSEAVRAALDALDVASSEVDKEYNRIEVINSGQDYAFSDKEMEW